MDSNKPVFGSTPEEILIAHRILDPATLRPTPVDALHQALIRVEATLRLLARATPADADLTLDAIDSALGWVAIARRLIEYGGDGAAACGQAAALGEIA